MLEELVQLTGGIGLFLLGMSLLTDSIKDMAGESLRLWLARFTGSVYKALFSGIGFTLILQSSTATTLATIGFVSAGVLTFSQSIGVVIGANIGTTSTGWIVALLGVKFSITNLALPLIALGAILKILTHGRVALIGLCLAGFGLIFFGIDQLQLAMSGIAGKVDLSIFTTKDFIAKLLLVLIGVVMTVLLQSSSAAITVTLTALASHTIQLEQALLLVIGQNIGTVATAVLAAIGSAVAAQRTAMVHVVFNLMSAVLAFCFLIPLFKYLESNWSWFNHLDDVLIVAGFHTLFSVLGALFFISFLKQFELILIKVIPEQKTTLVSQLDQASLTIPAIAIHNAQQVIYEHMYIQLECIKNALEHKVLIGQKKLIEFDYILNELDRYLDKIALPESEGERKKLLYLSRLVVYQRVLRSDLEQLDSAKLLHNQPKIYQLALDYVAILDRYITHIFKENDLSKSHNFYQELSALKQWSDDNRDNYRSELVSNAHKQQLSAAKNVELLAAQRWLERVIAHTKRLARVLMDQH